LSDETTSPTLVCKNETGGDDGLAIFPSAAVATCATS